MRRHGTSRCRAHTRTRSSSHWETRLARGPACLLPKRRVLRVPGVGRRRPEGPGGACRPHAACGPGPAPESCFAVKGVTGTVGSRNTAFGLHAGAVPGPRWLCGATTSPRSWDTSVRAGGGASGTEPPGRVGHTGGESAAGSRRVPGNDTQRRPALLCSRSFRPETFSEQKHPPIYLTSPGPARAPKNSGDAAPTQVPSPTSRELGGPAHRGRLTGGSPWSPVGDRATTCPPVRVSGVLPSRTRKDSRAPRENQA